MKRKLLSTLIAGLGLAGAGMAQAQISGNVVKIGVLSDMSGLYADIGGPGSLVAAKMAVDDYLRMVFKTPVKPEWRERCAAGTMAS
jgi:branched-chain amino acid transport system substrate-binding protein